MILDPSLMSHFKRFVLPWHPVDAPSAEATCRGPSPPQPSAVAP